MPNLMPNPQPYCDFAPIINMTLLCNKQRPPQAVSVCFSGSILLKKFVAYFLFFYLLTLAHNGFMVSMPSQSIAVTVPSAALNVSSKSTV